MQTRGQEIDCRGKDIAHIMSNEPSDIDTKALFSRYRELEQKIKKLGLPRQDIIDIITEKQELDLELAHHRSMQFRETAHSIRNAKTGEASGSLLWDFAKHIVQEIQIDGLQRNKTAEEITDGLRDMDTHQQEGAA